MRYSLFILLIVVAVSNGRAQSVSAAIVNTAGNTYNQNGITYEWNVGELALVETMSNSYGSITNGLLQPGMPGKYITPLNITVLASNILSPNGDGKNDYWVISDILSYPNNNVAVYDRAGRTVYSKHAYTNDWGGTLRGSPLTEDTYYYSIDLGIGQPAIKGFITIIRDRR